MTHEKSRKIYSEALFHFVKRQSKKNKKGETRSEVIVSAKSTVIIGISCLTLVISFFAKC